MKSNKWFGTYYFLLLTFLHSLLDRCLRDGRKIVHFQAGAAYQRPVNVWLAKELGCVGTVHRAAILNADGLGCLRAKQLGQRRTDMIRQNGIGVLRAGRFACSNRPNRFVRDDDFRGFGGIDVSQPQADLAADNLPRLARFRIRLPFRPRKRWG